MKIYLTGLNYLRLGCLAKIPFPKSEKRKIGSKTIISYVIGSHTITAYRFEKCYGIYE